MTKGTVQRQAKLDLIIRQMDARQNPSRETLNSLTKQLDELECEELTELEAEERAKYQRLIHQQMPKKGCGLSLSIAMLSVGTTLVVALGQINL